MKKFFLREIRQRELTDLHYSGVFPACPQMALKLLALGEHRQPLSHHLHPALSIQEEEKVLRAARYSLSNSLKPILWQLPCGLEKEILEIFVLRHSYVTFL